MILRANVSFCGDVIEGFAIFSFRLSDDLIDSTMMNDDEANCCSASDDFHDGEVAGADDIPDLKSCHNRVLCMGCVRTGVMQAEC